MEVADQARDERTVQKRRVLSTRFLSATCIGAVALVVVAYVLYSRQQALKERRAIAAFSASITVGMSKNDAMRACEGAADSQRLWRFKYWEKHEDAGGLSAAAVYSPLTFGAGNCVVAVLVRTEDTSSWKPEGAPEDRVDEPSRSQLAGFRPET